MVPPGAGMRVASVHVRGAIQRPAFRSVLKERSDPPCHSRSVRFTIAPSSNGSTTPKDSLVLDGDERIGMTIIRRAPEEPLRWIATTPRHEGAVVVQKIRDEGADGGGRWRHGRHVLGYWFCRRAPSVHRAGGMTCSHPVRRCGCEGSPLVRIASGARSDPESS